jgi:hypothetical protein
VSKQTDGVYSEVSHTQALWDNEWEWIGVGLRIEAGKETAMHHWTCRDGTKIKFRDMTDSHLLNAKRMLERRLESVRLDLMASPPSFGGEDAQYYAEREWESELERTYEDGIAFFKGGAEILKEVERRKLKA